LPRRQDAAPADPEQKSVTELGRAGAEVDRRPALHGRDGKQIGLGTGLCLWATVIATNLHVIGEGRPVTVRAF